MTAMDDRLDYMMEAQRRYERQMRRRLHRHSLKAYLYLHFDTVTLFAILALLAFFALLGSL